MKNNFISILITNYNKSKFLKKSILSVKNQKYNNYEIIIFDDNSDDNSLEIIKKFKKIKLIKNHKKKNISPAINQINGIKKSFNKSKGNIVCLLDSDDYFKKNKLLEINNFFERNKKKSVLYNLPVTSEKIKFHIKKKNLNYVWPTIFPTSCISVKRDKFEFFLKNIKHDKFKNLEIDARIIIFFTFYYNQYNVLLKKLTYYNFDLNGITAKISKYSKFWWLRRYEAFKYLEFVKKKKNEKFRYNLDFCITSIFNFLLRL